MSPVQSSLVQSTSVQWLVTPQSYVCREHFGLFDHTFINQCWSNLSTSSAKFGWFGYSLLDLDLLDQISQNFYSFRLWPTLINFYSWYRLLNLNFENKFGSSVLPLCTCTCPWTCPSVLFPVSVSVHVFVLLSLSLSLSLWTCPWTCLSEPVTLSLSLCPCLAVPFPIFAPVLLSLSLCPFPRPYPCPSFPVP